MDLLGNAYADVLADRASARHALAIGQAQPVLNEMQLVEEAQKRLVTILQRLMAEHPRQHREQVEKLQLVVPHLSLTQLVLASKHEVVLHHLGVECAKCHTGCKGRTADALRE